MSANSTVIRNRGTTPVAIEITSVVGEGFSVTSPLSFTVPAKVGLVAGSSTITAEYNAPSEATGGAKKGSLTFTSTAMPAIPGDTTPTTRTVELRCTVIDSISVSATSVIFDSTVIGQVSATTRTVTISNSGLTPMTITPYISANFTLVSSAALTIAGGGTASVVMRFAPSLIGSTGNLTGTLTLTKSTGASLTVALSGLAKALPTITYLTASGSKVYDALGNKVVLRSIHWWGFDQAFSPGLLFARPYKSVTIGGTVNVGIMDDIKNAGFNSIRLAICIDITGVITGVGGVSTSPKPNVNPTGWNAAYINPEKNPDLFYSGTSGTVGLIPTTAPYIQNGVMTSLEILDKVIDYAEYLELRVILDMHCLAPNNSNHNGTQGKWYTTPTPASAGSTVVDSSGGTSPLAPARSETQAIAAWVFLANRYRNRPTVCAFDIINEPWNTTWDRNSNLNVYNTSLVSYYERVEAAIRNPALGNNPDVMLVLEGVGSQGADAAAVGGTGSGWNPTNIDNGNVDHTPLGTGLTTTQQSELDFQAARGLYYWGSGWSSNMAMLATVNNIPTYSQARATDKLMPAMSVANKVIYSPHDYATDGAGGLKQWFHPGEVIDADAGAGFYSSHNGLPYPDNMAEVWRRQWGYLAEQDIAPLWVGEFGARFITSETVQYARDVAWLNALGAYCKAHDIGWSYFAYNPLSEATGSGAVGGLAGPDYMVQQRKLTLLTNAGFFDALTVNDAKYRVIETGTGSASYRVTEDSNPRITET